MSKKEPQSWYPGSGSVADPGTPTPKFEIGMHVIAPTSLDTDKKIPWDSLKFRHPHGGCIGIIFKASGTDFTPDIGCQVVFADGESFWYHGSSLTPYTDDKKQAITYLQAQLGRTYSRMSYLGSELPDSPYAILDRMLNGNHHWLVRAGFVSEANYTCDDIPVYEVNIERLKQFTAEQKQQTSPKHGDCFINQNTGKIMRFAGEQDGWKSISDLRHDDQPQYRRSKQEVLRMDTEKPIDLAIAEIEAILHSAVRTNNKSLACAAFKARMMIALSESRGSSQSKWIEDFKPGIEYLEAATTLEMFFSLEQNQNCMPPKRDRLRDEKVLQACTEQLAILNKHIYASEAPETPETPKSDQKHSRYACYDGVWETRTTENTPELADDNAARRHRWGMSSDGELDSYRR